MRPRFERVAPGSEEATRLLRDYLAELQARFADGHAMRAVWDPSVYGTARSCIALAYVDDVAVGCAGLREHTREACELKHFFIAPRARRMGVGAAFVAAMEAFARSFGYERVVLDTAAPLVEAARLYVRCGYRAVEKFNDNPYAAHWFEKTL
jgi:GNAT superfamily N-acetyltransferase